MYWHGLTPADVVRLCFGPPNRSTLTLDDGAVLVVTEALLRIERFLAVTRCATPARPASLWVLIRVPDCVAPSSSPLDTLAQLCEGFYDRSASERNVSTMDAFRP